MKTIIYKSIFILVGLCAIYGLSISKYNLRGQTGTEGLTFYQMALHAQGHCEMLTKNDTEKSTHSVGTNVVGAVLSDVTVDHSPYEITRCDQVLMLTAERISDHDDYTSRAPGFFTISAYLVNMFESKDSNKLLESINQSHIKTIPSIIRGSKNCILFQDDYSHRKITLCSEDSEVIDAADEAYSKFMSCRMGDDLNDFDPVTINNVLTASCNGFNSTTGVEFDMPTIRAKVASELKQSGFDVTETTTSGPASFGLGNNTNTITSAKSTPMRKMDLRVPGTY